MATRLTKAQQAEARAIEQQIEGWGGTILRRATATNPIVVFILVGQVQAVDASLAEDAEVPPDAVVRVKPHGATWRVARA